MIPTQNAQKVNKPPDYHHVEVPIATCITARLMVKRADVPFKYRVRFKFQINSDYKQRHNIPDQFSKYNEFMKYFNENTVVNATKNMNQPVSIALNFCSLLASQILTVYERTVGIPRLVENVNKFHFNVDEIIARSKSIKGLCKNEQADNLKVNALTNDVKLCVQHFQSEYDKKICCVSHSNKKNNNNVPHVRDMDRNTYVNIKKRRQNFDNVTVSTNKGSYWTYFR